MQKLTWATALLSAIAVVIALPAPEVRSLTARDLTPVPEKASATEFKFQPAFDFDDDSCYHTASIDPDGNLNPGRETSTVTEWNCRHIDSIQAYSRHHCNNNVCGIVYAYYYEHDSTGTVGGHRHDWEHVVVFGWGDEVYGGAVSAHGKWLQKDAKDGGFLLGDDKGPFVVYHKSGASTHAHRWGTQGDLDDIENETHKTVVAPLIGWQGWPTGHREKVMGNDWGSATIELDNPRFKDALKNAGASKYGLDSYATHEEP